MLTQENMTKTMRLGIMQPYLFPYIGYFQLIQMADSFVIADDVQWIDGGWINRNRVLMNGQVRYLTLPIRKISKRRPINEYPLGLNVAVEKKKIMQRLKESYRKAPHFEEVFELVHQCFSNEENNAARFISEALAECCRYIGIETPFVYSSELKISDDLKAEARVIEINHIMKANHYINPIGGKQLYSKEKFNECGLQLSFLKPREIHYQQGQEEFVPDLSIIDILMYNSAEETMELLKEFELE